MEKQNIHFNNQQNRNCIAQDLKKKGKNKINIIVYLIWFSSNWPSRKRLTARVNFLLKLKESDFNTVEEVWKAWRKLPDTN